MTAATPETTCPQPLPPDELAALAATFKALGDPTRAQLVFILLQRELNVNELSQHVAVSPSAVSHHLAKLRALQLVQSRRDGNQVFYQVDNPQVLALFQQGMTRLESLHTHSRKHSYQGALELLAARADQGAPA